MVGWENLKLICVNNAWRPVAETIPADAAELTLYAADADWWEHYRPDQSDMADRFDMYGSHELIGNEYGVNPLMVDERLSEWDLSGTRLAHLGCSGAQAINLAAAFGARLALLIGFDMTNARASHFDGDHPDKLRNAQPNDFVKWRAAIDAAGPVPGMDVINCTPGSALTAFPFGDLEDSLNM